MADRIERGPEPCHPFPWSEEGSPWRLIDGTGETVIYLQQLQPFPDPNDLAALCHRVNNYKRALAEVERLRETVRRIEAEVRKIPDLEVRPRLAICIANIDCILRGEK